jgi:hypothetical protein
VTPKVDLSAELQVSNDRAEFKNGPTPAVVTPVPDAKYNRQVTRLTGRYALEKASGVRVQWIHDRFSTNDWTWDTWAYSDGTRILPNSQQKVDFFGATYYYNF